MILTSILYMQKSTAPLACEDCSVNLLTANQRKNGLSYHRVRPKEANSGSKDLEDFLQAHNRSPVLIPHMCKKGGLEGGFKVGKVGSSRSARPWQDGFPALRESSQGLGHPHILWDWPKADLSPGSSAPSLEPSSPEPPAPATSTPDRRPPPANDDPPLLPTAQIFLAYAVWHCLSPR